MLTREGDIDAHALRRRDWTISAIARHLDRDRKTVQAYLSGDRSPGVRASSAADWFARSRSTCPQACPGSDVSAMISGVHKCLQAPSTAIA